MTAKVLLRVLHTFCKSIIMHVLSVCGDDYMQKLSCFQWKIQFIMIWLCFHSDVMVILPGNNHLQRWFLVLMNCALDIGGAHPLPLHQWFGLIKMFTQGWEHKCKWMSRKNTLETHGKMSAKAVINETNNNFAPFLFQLYEICGDCSGALEFLVRSCAPSWIPRLKQSQWPKTRWCTVIVSKCVMACFIVHCTDGI